MGALQRLDVSALPVKEGCKCQGMQVHALTNPLRGCKAKRMQVEEMQGQGMHSTHWAGMVEAARLP